jgi:hypothetical protein
MAQNRFGVRDRAAPSMYAVSATGPAGARAGRRRADLVPCGRSREACTGREWLDAAIVSVSPAIGLPDGWRVELVEVPPPHAVSAVAATTAAVAAVNLDKLLPRTRIRYPLEECRQELGRPLKRASALCPHVPERRKYLVADRPADCPQ